MENYLLTRRYHTKRGSRQLPCCRSPGPWSQAHTWYLSFFSPQAQFLVPISSTQNLVNRDRTNFSTNQGKLKLNRFCDKTAKIVTKLNFLHIFPYGRFVSPFLMWRNFFTWQIFLHISPHTHHVEKLFHMTKYLHFSLWRISRHLKLSVVEFLFFHVIICHMEFFFINDMFFSTATPSLRPLYAFCLILNRCAWRRLIL